MSDSRLIEAVARMESLLSAHIKHQGEINERLTKELVSQDHWVNGNGQPGAKTRLDRLEQAQGRRDWIAKAMALPIIGLMLDWIVKHWSGT